MTDDSTAGTSPEDASSPEHPAGNAWRDVISQLDELGDAMGRWARAATQDPANRERAEELKQHLEKMADTVGGAVDEAASNDVGQSFKDAANKTGSAFRAAGDRVAEEVSPRVAAAFRATAEKLHQASERMESKAAEQAADEPDEATASEAAPEETGDEPSDS